MKTRAIPRLFLWQNAVQRGVGYRSIASFFRQNSETGSLLVEGQLFLEDVDLGGHLRGLEVCVLQALNSAE